LFDEPVKAGISDVGFYKTKNNMKKELLSIVLMILAIIVSEHVMAQSLPTYTVSIKATGNGRISPRIGDTTIDYEIREETYQLEVTEGDSVSIFVSADGDHRIEHVWFNDSIDIRMGGEHGLRWNGSGDMDYTNVFDAYYWEGHVTKDTKFDVQFRHMPVTHLLTMGTSNYGSVKITNNYKTHELAANNQAEYDIDEYDSLVVTLIPDENCILLSLTQADINNVNNPTDITSQVVTASDGSLRYVMASMTEDCYLTATFASTASPEPYAVLSEGNTVLTFYYDEKKAERDALNIDVDQWIVFDPVNPKDAGWWNQRGSITTVVFDTSFANCTSLTKTNNWFYECENLVTITGINNLKTDNVTNMEYMFAYCSSLTSLDVTGFNTQNVTDMSSMFRNCYGLTNLNVSGFNTQNVTDMGLMFSGCSGLTSLDVTGFNTQNVTNMRDLFERCSGLTSLDVTGFNTQNVTDMYGMFARCSSLTSLDVSGFNTTNVTSMGIMFYYCSGLTSLDVSGFNTSNVTDLSWMFSGCSSLTSLDVNGFDTSNATDISGLFEGCSSLTSLDVSNLKTDNVTSMDEMFERCSGLTSLDVSAFNTSNVTSMEYMFGRCDGLTTLDLSTFNTANVTNMSNMFRENIGLTSLNLSNFNTSNVTVLEYMFNNCPNITTLDLSSFNTTKVKDMDGMFGDCSALTTIYVGDNWTTANIENSYEMFAGCNNLVGGAGTQYNESHIDHTYAHIDEGTTNPGYFTNKNTLAPFEPIVVNLINNSDLEGNDNGNFYYRKILVLNEALPQEISNNVGVNESRGIRIETTDKQENVYDNELWFRLNQPVSEGTRFKLTYDYRADQEALVYVGAHSPAFFGDFIWDWMEPYVSFGTEWQTYTLEGTVSSIVSSDQKPLGSLAFSLNETPEANTYYFDNVKFEVYLDDQCPKPTFTQDNNTVSIHSPFDATIYYTLDGNEPTTNSPVYTGPLSFTQNETILAMAVVNGYEASPIATYQFEYTEPFNEAWFDGLTAYVMGGATLDDAFAQTGGRNEAAKTIAAIIWEGNTALTADMLQGINNPNLLVYVSEPSMAPQGIQNVVISGQAKEIILTDATSGNNNFFCPEPFWAEKISYTRNFQQHTEIGVSRGWEGLALPFNVQTITHQTHGELAPFEGMTNNAKPFWLRYYTGDNVESAHNIEAYVPYVIAMPNSNDYFPEYNQAGQVTFSASNTEVHETPDFSFMENEPNMQMMTIPTFQLKAKSDSIYAINVGEPRNNYAEGSVFESGLRDVRPFEIYTVHHGQGARPRFIPIPVQGNESNGIADIKVTEPTDHSQWYDLSGRKLSGEPMSKGIYIHKGQKVKKMKK
jgi:surface protein